MTAAETIERLTALVKMQADIIQSQALLLLQYDAATELDEAIEAAERERYVIKGGVNVVHNG